jgi:hypothetical protein
MNSIPLEPTGSHEYGLKSWMKLVYLIGGVFFLVTGAVFGPAFFRTTTTALPVMLPVLLFMGFGIYMLAQLARARLVIDGSRIEVRGAFTDRSAELSEIEGFRTINSRNGSYLKLQLREGRGSITIPQSFDTDDAYRAWMQRLTDLDQRGREEILAEVAQQEELGSTPEERLQALPTARTWALFLSLATGLAAAGLAFGPIPLRLPGMVVLVIMPMIAVVLLHRAPLLYAIFKPKADPRAELMAVPLAAGFGFLFRASGVHFVSTQSLLMIAVPVALVYGLAFVIAGRRNAMQPGSWFAAIAIAGLYAYGLTSAVDTLADRAAATNYETTVLSKHVSRGRSTTYYLDLAPWGPFTFAPQVKVPSSTYRAVAEGDEVCIQLHPGALHLPWYRVTDCETPFPNDGVQ